MGVVLRYQFSSLGIVIPSNARNLLFVRRWQTEKQIPHCVRNAYYRVL
jgi:hypothetical protein